MGRIRQDADLPKRERDMNDRCAIDMYDQVLQGAVRDGHNINDTDDEEEADGYVKPVWDNHAAFENDIAALKAEKVVDETRQTRVKQLRGSKAHNELPPIERLAVEVEVWNGQRVASAPPTTARGATHRVASSGGGDDELASSQVDVAPHESRLVATPSYMRGRLRDYQLEGVNWLIDLRQRVVNGILADEMGLGKTFQTITLIAYVKYTLGLPGPHLVVVPKSVLGNWYREFKRWCPTITVLKFHGPAEVRPQLVETYLRKQPLRFDVVLTTYDMILREVHPFKRIAWHYLIVDEAHKLKNAEGSTYTVMASLKTRHRLLITGTPLQNNLKELWALLAFLAPALFDDVEVITKGFDIKQADPQAIHHLHAVMAATMLRRLKADVNTAIPPKREIYVSCGIAAKQREWYLKVLAREAGSINRATGSREAIMNIIMQLRKAVNHPYLFAEADPSGGFLTDEGIVRDCGKMVVLDKLLAKLKKDEAGKHKVLLFSQMTRMLDIIEDYLNLRGYHYCRIDGSTGGVDRDMQMAEFNNKNSSKFIFLLSTRAGGLGINLQAANHVVIYDSDWNPQMDLQAQDRAHRIGQTREVRVYRFITDGTVEERVYQRALKKLYLDALIVQQGRSQAQRQKDAASKDELMSIVRFGATEMFKSKGAEVTDADIDALLSTGESKMSELQKGVLKEQKQTLANFDFGVEEANLYDFEGVVYSRAASRVLEVELPEPTSAAELTVIMQKHGDVMKVILHPSLERALVQFRDISSAANARDNCGLRCQYTNREGQQLVVTSDMIDEHGDYGGRGKREHKVVESFEEEISRAAAARKVPAPKLPRKPTFSAWWLANETRINELYEIECGNIIQRWRRRLDAKPATTLIDSEADTGVDAPKDATTKEEAEGDDGPALSAEQEAEKQALWAAAFTSWSHADVRQFIAAMTELGIPRGDYDAISKAMHGAKSPEEVAAYSRAFWELGPTRLPNFESYEKRIAKFTKRRDVARHEAEICLAKVRSCEGDPAENLRLPLKPLASASADFDRQLYLNALRPDGTWDADGARARMLQGPFWQFDVFMLSRPKTFFTQRAHRLRQAVLAEANKASGHAGTKRDRRTADNEKSVERDSASPSQPRAAEEGTSPAQS
jgi:SWI/SNF-related matrix-associated actin-dependent regulator of chromatin subfamily A member 5